MGVPDARACPRHSSSSCRRWRRCMVTSTPSLPRPPKLSGLCSIMSCHFFSVITNSKRRSNPCPPALRRFGCVPNSAGQYVSRKNARFADRGHRPVRRLIACAGLAETSITNQRQPSAWRPRLAAPIPALRPGGPAHSPSDWMVTNWALGGRRLLKIIRINCKLYLLTETH